MNNARADAAAISQQAEPAEPAEQAEPHIGQQAEHCLALPTAAPLLASDPVWPALAKLGAQFTREGRCQHWQALAVAEQRVLLLAWAGGADLSGCSKDKINQVLEFAAARGGVPVLGVHGMPIAPGPKSPAPVQLWTRPQLKAAVANGELTAASRSWPIGPLPAATWREQAGAPLAQGAWAAVWQSL